MLRKQQLIFVSNFAVRADVLQRLHVNNVDMKQCKDSFKDETSPIYPTLQICAGGVEGKDSCNGDSGAGLIDAVRISPNKTRYNLAGIVSWGSEMCGDGKPGVYTRVAAFLDWILNSVGRLPIQTTMKFANIATLNWRGGIVDNFVIPTKIIFCFS